MIEVKVEYSIERKTEKGKAWENMYVWKVDVNTVSGVTSDLNTAKQKLTELREWAELNNYLCQYRIIKTITTTEVLDE